MRVLDIGGFVVILIGTYRRQVVVLVSVSTLTLSCVYLCTGWSSYRAHTVDGFISNLRKIFRIKVIITPKQYSIQKNGILNRVFPFRVPDQPAFF